ncbi:tetratricopeptide repeat protein [Tenacibaculum sp. 190524A05c]|uniref:tetratricopeptide repeat protein n=1 Tax=Tenacibaculum platacis TaxID=3137852 RepID=UPI0032B0F50C
MDKFSLIEKYFEGTLSVSEQEEFDKFLDTDVEFKKEFEFQKDVQNAIRKNTKLDLKEELKALEKESFPRKDKKKYSQYLKIAASVVVLLSVGIHFLLNSNTVNSEAIYEEHFAPFENVVRPIVRGEESEDKEFKAFLSYEQQAYKKALVLFDELYSKSKKTHLLLYKANCLLQLNNTEQAIESLEDYLKTENAYADKAHWYLGLSNLKLGNTEKAKENFKQLQELGTYKKNTVDEILNEL